VKKNDKTLLLNIQKKRMSTVRTSLTDLTRDKKHK